MIDLGQKLRSKIHQSVPIWWTIRHVPSTNSPWNCSGLEINDWPLYTTNPNQLSSPSRAGIGTSNFLKKETYSSYILLQVHHGSSWLIMVCHHFKHSSNTHTQTHHVSKRQFFGNCQSDCCRGGTDMASNVWTSARRRFWVISVTSTMACHGFQWKKPYFCDIWVVFHQFYAGTIYSIDVVFFTVIFIFPARVSTLNLLRPGRWMSFCLKSCQSPIRRSLALRCTNRHSCWNPSWHCHPILAHAAR